MYVLPVVSEMITSLLWFFAELEGLDFRVGLSEDVWAWAWHSVTTCPFQKRPPVGLACWSSWWQHQLLLLSWPSKGSRKYSSAPPVLNRKLFGWKPSKECFLDVGQCEPELASQPSCVIFSTLFTSLSLTSSSLCDAIELDDPLVSSRSLGPKSQLDKLFS